MPQTSEILTPSVIEKLREEIAAADGAEIFCVLTREKENGLFNHLSVVCRGTHSEVPALVSRTKPGDMTLHNHPSGVVQPSQADMQVATMFGEEGVGSMIVDNDVSKCMVIVEPHVEPKPVDVDEHQVMHMFASDGPMAKTFPDYESREPQIDMAVEVVRSLNHRKILAVEAGTGTGKSLAYLIPSLLWTRENKGRVVIATKTIALQEQLVYKDIPLARSVVPNAPQASLVKGRQNYICMRKLQDLRTTQLALFAEEDEPVKREIESLDGWMESGGTGDRADLPFVPTRDAWEAVRSDADMCLGAKCPFYQRSPFYVSRRRAAQSRVLVLNQALLFSDLAMRSQSGNYKTAAVIPPYEHVILDEAHSVEDIATDHFGEKIASFGLRLTLGKFLSTSKSNKGTIHRLFQASLEHEATRLTQALEEGLLKDFRHAQEMVIGQLYQLASVLHQTFNKDQRKNVVLWLKPAIMESPDLNPAREEAKSLFEELRKLLMVVRRIREKTTVESDQFLEKMNGLLIEMDARAQRLSNTLVALKQFAIKPDDNKVPWLELKRTRDREEFEYKVSPLDVTGLLRDALFKPFKSVVMTSATLNLNDDFDFLASRNGLKGFEEKDWHFLSLKSPFKYEQQARLLLVDPNSNPNEQTYIHDLTDLILKAHFSGVRGGTLVLFTSYSMLNRVAYQLEGPLARGGVDLLVQGRDQRTRLVARMKQTQGVLLGTDSFWEGVDLPGLALTKVIVTKLPFRQIGDPIFEARCTQIDTKGGSSFKELSLPLALLKFKQGAGRLIRKAEDRGYLIVADNRVRTKAYGRKFLTLVDNYPSWETNLQHLEHMLEPLEHWP